MKAFLIGTALVTALTSAALAESATRTRSAMAQMSHQQQAQKVQEMAATDVVVAGRVVGRDPSQSVRASLATEQFSLWAAGAEGGGGDAGGGNGGGGDAP